MSVCVYYLCVIFRFFFKSLSLCLMCVRECVLVINHNISLLSSHHQIDQTITTILSPLLLLPTHTQNLQTNTYFHPIVYYSSPDAFPLKKTKISFFLFLRCRVSKKSPHTHIIYHTQKIEKKKVKYIYHTVTKEYGGGKEERW